MDTPRFAILLAALSTATVFSAEGPDGFGSDFESASRLSVETGKPLLIHFYADYCPPCRRMEREVLHDAELNSKLSDLVVSVKVNTAQRPDLARKFSVDRIPHDRIISPDGKELKRTGGFIDKWSYLANVQDAVTRYAATQPKKPSKPAVAKADPADKQEKTFMGLDGFCPVALNTKRKWQKGAAKYETAYKGVAYRLSSKKNLDLFEADPDRYAPQVLGCDPVVLAASHKAVPGRTDYGAFFDNRLYLFESGDSRQKFKKNPLRYVRIQHALDASKIVRTSVR